MLRAMATPEDPSETPHSDRRAVPRHLRDGENELLSSTGAFGRRAEDALSGRGRGWLLAAAAEAAAVALGWLLLG
jgi:hypothetical protein